MKPLRILWAVVLVGIVAAGSLWADDVGQPLGSVVAPQFVGSNTDSTEQASRWFSVQGASRVIIKLWTTHATYSLNNADSAYSDSLQDFRILLSDSVAFIARDSLGTIVTARSTFLTPKNARTFPVCVDSLSFSPTSITNAVIGDTSMTSGSMLVCKPAPVKRELRGPSNGYGATYYIAPIEPGSATAEKGGVFGKRYMRIMFTPLRRNTGNGTTSTQGLRVNGLKGLTMSISVLYPSTINN